MNQERQALVLGLLAVACWSTVATAFKLTLGYVDTFQLVFYSTLTASVTLLIIVVVRSGPGELVATFKQHWRLTLLAGSLNPVAYYLILFKAYDLLPAQVAQPINYTWAIVLTLMAIVFLKQPVRGGDLLAAVICYAGVFVIATQGDITSFAGADLAGVGLALLSTFIWAGYWTINIKDEREPTVGLCLNFLVALPVTLIICLLFSSLSVPLRGLAGSVYVGLIEMAFAFLLWSSALKLTANASRVSNLIFLAPFVSLAIIHRVLGEEIYATTLVGLVLIVAGLLYQQYIHRVEATA